MDKTYLFFLLSIILFIALGGGLFFAYRYRKTLQEKAKRFGFLWNVLLTLFLLTGVFLGIESYYRFISDQTDSFGMSLVSEKWLQTHYQLNNFKARDDVDYQLAVPEGKRRVTFIGDSFTAGHGIKQVKDRFANRLREAHPELDIHVMAANGMESPDQLGLLEKIKGESYEFDVVLLVYVPNDISLFVPETYDLYDKVDAFKEGLNFFTGNSYFLNHLYYRKKAQAEPAIRNYYDYLAKSYFSSPWEKEKEILMKMDSLVTASGAVFGIVNFPFLHQLGEGYTFRGAHQQLAAFCQQNQILHLDLLSLFEDHLHEDLTVNQYDAHPNERAHQIAAEAISPFLYSKK